MKAATFDFYIEKYSRLFDEWYSENSQDITVQNAIEMSLIEFKLYEFLKFGLIAIFLILPSILPFIPIALTYKFIILVIVWPRVIYILINKYEWFIPRIDYLNQLNGGLRNIIQLQNRINLNIDASIIRDLLFLDNDIDKERRLKLFSTQQKKNVEDKKHSDIKKLSFLLEAHFVYSKKDCPPIPKSIDPHSGVLTPLICIRFFCHSDRLTPHDSKSGFYFKKDYPSLKEKLFKPFRQIDPLIR